MPLGYDEIHALSDGLVTEMQLVLAIKEGGVAQRRLLVRTLFSVLEAQAFVLKQHALESYRHGKVSFSPKELAGLEETGKRFLSVKENLKLAVKSYAKARGVEPLDLQSYEPSFSQALAVRHRITHPKHPSDLEMTTDEAQALGRASGMVKDIAQWRTDAELALIERIKKEIHDSTERLKAEITATLQAPPKEP